jgi:hypothetical protein
MKKHKSYQIIVFTGMVDLVDPGDRQGRVCVTAVVGLKAHATSCTQGWSILRDSLCGIGTGGGRTHSGLVAERIGIGEKRLSEEVAEQSGG